MRKFLPAATAVAIILCAGQVQAGPGEDAEFLFRLGMLQGHLMVGHDLLKAGKPKLGLPHFGHPVRELYDDVKDYVTEKHIPPFEAALVDLESAAAKAPDSAETETKYQAVIAALEQARDATPASVRASVPAMVEICADTIDAAAGEYGEAINKGRIDDLVEYHDSRGFISYVGALVDKLSAAHPSAADSSLIERFKPILAKAQAIVAPLIPPETPSKSVADYRAVAAEARAVVKQ